MTVNDIIQAMQRWAPEGLAYSWDKIGLATGSPDQPVTKIMTCLTITQDAVRAAKRAKAEMIVSHHPLIWEPITTLRSDNPLSKLFLDIHDAGIACYSAHTNLDVAEAGVNYILADRLGLKNKAPLFPTPQAGLQKLVTFVPKTHAESVLHAVYEAGAGNMGYYTHASFTLEGVGTFRPNEHATPFSGIKGVVNHEPELRFETIVPKIKSKQIIAALLTAHPYEEPAYDLYDLDITDHTYSLGLRGELSKAVTLDTFAKQVKKNLAIDYVRVSGKGTAKVKRIAVMGGAGGDQAGGVPSDVDVFVTGDVKYHNALDALDAGLNIIDAGHHGTEKWIVPAIQDYLKSELDGVKVSAYMEPEPFRLVR